MSSPVAVEAPDQEPDEAISAVSRRSAYSSLVASKTPTADYMYANRDGIKNRLVPLASPGLMEKAIDILASRRLKSRGMSWRRPGAYHMVRLRPLRLNNRWHEFWNQRRQAQRWEWPVAA